MSDIPNLCGQCLGQHGHIKMIKQSMGEQCKLCTRPFTIFRWNSAGEHRQSKKTILCYTCAESRNCCQSCMVDIDYGIPLDIRDAALKMAGLENHFAVDSVSRNAEVKALMADKLEHKKDGARASSSTEKKEKAKAILETLAAKLSNTSVPRPHQKALEVSSRDLGKTISKLPFGGTIIPPEDTKVKSFFIFGFSTQTPHYLITSFFERFGTLGAVTVVHQARCGYVSFARRVSAEKCAEHLKANDHNGNMDTAALILLNKKEPIRVSWGIPKPLGNSKEEESKIAIVVNKVMKQLADKDSAKKRGSFKNESAQTFKSQKTRDGKTSPVNKRYKAASQDFEA